MIPWLKTVSVSAVLFATAGSTIASGVPLQSPFVQQLGSEETLDDVAVRCYGNRHYSMVLELHNNIRDPWNIEPGTPIKVPKLDAMLAEEGVASMMPLPVYRMLEARASYMEIEDRLWSLRKEGVDGYVTVPESLQLVLRQLSQDFWDVAMGLREEKPGMDVVPNRAIGQLKAISFALRRLSYGAIDPFGYEIEKIHQRLAWAICNKIVWARNGYR